MEKLWKVSVRHRVTTNSGKMKLESDGLIVEDVVDTGASMQALEWAQKMYEKQDPEVTSVVLTKATDMMMYDEDSEYFWLVGYEDIYERSSCVYVKADSIEEARRTAEKRQDLSKVTSAKQDKKIVEFIGMEM